MIWEIWLSGLLFAVQHSLLAGTTCKSQACKLGLDAKTYRRFYVLAALLTTATWLTYVRSLPDQPLYTVHGAWSWALRGLQAIGLWMTWLALRPIDTLAFLGVRSGKNGPDGFIEAGIYRRLRHPMYSGVMLIMLAFPVQTQNSLNLYACVALYFILGARLEEGRLQRQYPAYADYRRRVPAFLPRLRPLSGKPHD
ncbi:MAG: isoprenylcysteine carboxylmethyltransferase family protein [Gammaproteobacteria bacterium]|nr:isoprenylcysteine carboxylmethyltransferase family protein [Gammaproteobacteria bacterium]